MNKPFSLYRRLSVGSVVTIYTISGRLQIPTRPTRATRQTFRVAGVFPPMAPSQAQSERRAR